MSASDNALGPEFLPPDAPVSTPEPATALSAEEHLRTIGRGGAGMLLGQLANSGLRYVAVVLIGRGLGAAAFGDFGLVMTLERFTQVLADAGLSQANLKFVAHCLALGDQSGARAVARLTGVLSAAFGAALFLALWLLAPAIAHGLYHRPDLILPLRVAAAAIPLGSVTGTLLSVQQAARNIWPLVLVARVGVPLLFLAGVAVVIGLRGDLTALLWAYVATTGLGLLVALVLLARWLAAGRGDPQRAVGLREVVRFSLTVCVGAIAGLILGSADVLILGRFVPAAELGVYVAGARTAAFIALPLFALNALFAPVIADLFARQDLDGLQRSYAATTRWSTGAAFGLLGPMIIAPSLFLGMFGREFPQGALVLIILGLGQLVNAATGGVAWLLTMTGSQALLAWTNWVCAAVLVGGLVLAAQFWGGLGAAVCMGAVTAGVNLARLAWVYRRLGIHPYDRRFLTCAAVTGLAIAGLALVARVGGALWSVGAVAAFAVVFAVVARYGWAAGLGAVLARRPAAPPS